MFRLLNQTGPSLVVRFVSIPRKGAWIEHRTAAVVWVTNGSYWTVAFGSHTATGGNEPLSCSNENATKPFSTCSVRGDRIAVLGMS